MGLLSKISRLSQRLRGNHRFDDPHTSINRLRICRFEEVESRRMMAADLHVGAVYYDPASGLDTKSNVIQITFEGGVEGTQLTHLVIDGSKDGGPLKFNDAIFDTAAGGLGAYGFSPLSIVSHTGFQVTSSHVEDGGTALSLDFQGFKAGMKLVLTIDVDQVLFIGTGPANGDVEVDSVDEGAEFQRSHFVTTFVAPHYHDVTTSTQFWDKYDANFAAADKNSGTKLDLPSDRYSDPSTDQSVLTAGAVATAVQQPLPNSLSGVVFADTNLNNRRDPGEQGIGGVQLALYQYDGTQYVPTSQTTMTDSQGRYHFDQLAIGKYRVIETQPGGYFSVGAEPGTVNGQIRGVVTTVDILSDLTLLGGEDSIENDFAEALPNSISGHVGNDVTGDCETNPNTPPIVGVVMHLLDSSGKVVATTKTDQNGNYSFSNLAAGTYTVHEEQPAGYLEDDAHVGSVGGVVTDQDTLSQIKLTTNLNGVHYDFCEVLPVSIAGHVGIDTTGDCDGTPNTPPIAGVVIELLDGSGKIIGTTKTDANGNYSFNNMAPGTYGVHEEQPVGYFQGDEHAGSQGGDVSTDTIAHVILLSGVHAINYNFCELLPVGISGLVRSTTTGDCNTDPNAKPIAGVTIELLNATGNVIDTAKTDAQGHYSFVNLPPGTYSVHEIQPAGYFNGDTDVGSAGGTMGDDIVTDVMLMSGVQATDYDFCEMPPASLCGFVYSDLNNNGRKDDGEAGIANVTLILRNANGQPTGATTTTDATGFYCFVGLPAGTYGISEVQPTGYLDGLDSAGTNGGTAQNPGDLISGAVLMPGDDAEDYDFGELLPASIGGLVRVSPTGDCQNDPNVSPLSGVVVHLIDANGSVIGTTKTDSNGRYQFANLTPGTYSVQEDQPNGYFEGDSDVGSAGGLSINVNLLGNIELGSGTQGTDYDFCEMPPRTLSGFVFQDGPPIPVQTAGEVPNVPTVRDGKLTADDTRLAGVTLELRDGVTGQPILGSAALPGFYAANQPIRTVTDANGHYVFRGLPAGTYGVYDVKPGGYISGIDTAGSLGGAVISTWSVTDPAVLAQITAQPQDDAILQIEMSSAIDSNNNNFSLVTTAQSVQVFPLPQPIVNPLQTPPGPAVPLNEFFAPLNPLPPFLLSPLLTRAGGAMFTWHLSIVDAGQPRAVSAEEAVVKLTSLRQGDESTWEDGDLAEGEFILPMDARRNGQLNARKVVFGIRGAIPISGDFNGDGKSEVGVFKDGQWFIDLNDNGVWDAGDLWARLGHKGDRPVTGDWDGDGKTDIGIYGRAWRGDPRALAHEPGIPDPHNENTAVQKNVPRPENQTPVGKRTLQLTSTGKPRADLIDHVFLYGTAGDHPVVGDWNGDGTATIAVFRNGVWHRDMDGDGKWTKADRTAHFGQPGDLPVAGDFNGDGIDELGIYRDGVWYIDTNGNGVIDPEDQVFELGGPGDKPVVGDWNGDGTTEPGVFHDTSPGLTKAS